MPILIKNFFQTETVVVVGLRYSFCAWQEIKRLEDLVVVSYLNEHYCYDSL